MASAESRIAFLEGTNEETELDCHLLKRRKYLVRGKLMFLLFHADREYVFYDIEFQSSTWKQSSKHKVEEMACSEV